MAKKKNTCIYDCSRCRFYWRNECKKAKKQGGQVYIQLNFFDLDGNLISDNKCEK